MRYAWVVGALVLLVGGCNFWVALHNDGIVRGRVVQADGRPAAGATVSFWEKTLTTLERRAATETSPDGRFVLTGQAAHHFALRAEQSGLGASQRKFYRRYFRGQNLTLDEPLRLGEGR
jgi:Carboxypeptidase regulatory-like domain